MYIEPIQAHTHTHTLTYTLVYHAKARQLKKVIIVYRSHQHLKRFCIKAEHYITLPNKNKCTVSSTLSAEEPLSKHHR